MTNHSPAQLLAAVLRVAAPGHTVSHDSLRATVWDQPRGEGPLVLAPTSLSDLARVVAMLDGAQTMLFDHHLNIALETARTHMDSQRPNPAEVLKADPKTILAALVAAVGLGEGVKR